MGRWTTQYYDTVLADKLQLALKPALLNYEIKYETFVEELDGNDTVVQRLIDALVLDLAQRRTRPATPSSPGIRTRTASAARHVAGYGVPTYRSSLATAGPRVHRYHPTRSVRRADRFFPDDDIDGSTTSNAPAPQEAVEMSASSQNLHDAYDPHPPSYTSDLAMPSHEYWSVPGELEDIWDWQPTPGGGISLLPRTITRPQPAYEEGGEDPSNIPPPSGAGLARQSSLPPATALARQPSLRRPVPRPRHTPDFPTWTYSRRPAPRSYPYRSSSFTSRPPSSDNQWSDDSMPTLDHDENMPMAVPTSSATILRRLRHLEPPTVPPVSIPLNDTDSDTGVQSASSTDSAPPDPSAAAPRNWRSGSRPQRIPYPPHWVLTEALPTHVPSASNYIEPLRQMVDYPRHLPTPRSLSPESVDVNSLPL